MGLVNFPINVTTDASGAATGYTQGPVSGAIDSIRYIPDATNPLTSTAVATFTKEDDAEPVLTWTTVGTTKATKVPRRACHDVSGAALTFDGTHPFVDRITSGGARIKCVISGGGNTLSGQFVVTVDQDD